LSGWTISSSIAFTSGNVYAGSLVVGDLTVLARPTSVQSAGVLTLLVHTGLLGWTFTVTAAPNLFDAPIVGIYCETLGTEFTGSLVVFYYTGGVS
jgi:hypothetical protein